MWGNDLFESVYDNLEKARKDGEAFINEQAQAFKDAALKSVQWIWEALQGDFNDNLTTGQIAANVVLGLIPIIDQVLDVRDLIANCRTLYQDKTSKPAWIALCLTLVGLIPSLGSVAKGVLKIVFLFMRKTGGNVARALKPAMDPIFSFLCDPKVRKILGISDISAILKICASRIREVKGLASSKEILGQFDRMLAVADGLAAKIRPLAPESVLAWLNESIAIARALRKQADSMIAPALAPVQKVLDDIAAYLEKEAVERAPRHTALPYARSPHAIPPNLAQVNPRIITNAQKGLYGEIISDYYMTTVKSHKNLLPPERIKRSLQDKPNGRGIDGIYENASPPPPYIITETKYRTESGQYIDGDGSASTQTLSTTKDKTKQMSDKWIKDRLEQDLRNTELADKIKEEGYDRWLMIVGPSGKVEHITRLDAHANAIGTITP